MGIKKALKRALNNSKRIFNDRDHRALPLQELLPL
jgi:hypothetical protein